MTKYSFELAPRCGAKTKSRNGEPCLAPAMKNKKRCRVHGGKSTGAKDNLNALKHGKNTREMVGARKDLTKLKKLIKQRTEK